MAVVNRTPDSFFDRGITREFGAALDAASQAVADGAEIVDIGGVKAGPGDEVSPAAEIDRVAGLVAAVRERHADVVISVDTWRGEVGEVVAQAAQPHVRRARAEELDIASQRRRRVGDGRARRLLRLPQEVVLTENYPVLRPQGRAGIRVAVGLRRAVRVRASSPPARK